MLSKTISTTNTLALKSLIIQNIDKYFQPTLAILFASPQHNLNIITQIFSELTIDLVGCTTAGEIVNDQLLEGSIVVLLTTMNKNSYQLFFSEFSNETVYQAGFATGSFASRCYEHPGMMVMLSGLGMDAAVLLSGLKDGIGREVPIYGGLAGDDLNMVETFTISNEQISSKGLATLIIDTEKVEMQGLATSGWKPIGGKNTITKAKGNIIYTINDERAYDVFIRYFGLADKELTQEELIATLYNYPIQIIRDGGHTVLRLLFFFDKEKGSLTLSAGVRNGDKFHFSAAPGFDVIQQTVEEFSDFKNVRPEADAIILYSCKGRHNAFGPMLEEEVEGLYQHWKKPLIGFLSYGEIGNTANGTCEFHNETCSLVVLKKK